VRQLRAALGYDPGHQPVVDHDHQTGAVRGVTQVGDGRLPFECFLVQRPAGEARTVLLLFFSSPEAADKSKEISADILTSVDFAP
jgi:hypothetical protein